MRETGVRIRRFRIGWCVVGSVGGNGYRDRQFLSERRHARVVTGGHALRLIVDKVHTMS